MRAALWPLACLALAACEREPSFDERYAKAQSQLRAKDVAIEKELRAREAAQPEPEVQPVQAEPAPSPAA